MKTFVQPGLSVPLPMPYDRTSGQGVLIGALFGVVAAEPRRSRQEWPVVLMIRQVALRNSPQKGGGQTSLSVRR